MTDGSPFLIVCLDSNVYVSAIAFGGKPLEILIRALKREFQLMMGQNIIDEVSKTLKKKIGLNPNAVDQTLGDFINVARVIVPTGEGKYIEHKKDDLVLEVALTGKCDVLVTGDKKHLLPLSPFKNLIIESPSQFLIRFIN